MVEALHQCFPVACQPPTHVITEAVWAELILPTDSQEMEIDLGGTGYS